MMEKEFTLTLTQDEAILVFAALHLLDRPEAADMSRQIKDQIRKKLLYQEEDIHATP